MSNIRTQSTNQQPIEIYTDEIKPRRSTEQGLTDFMVLELSRASTVSYAEEGMNWTVQIDLFSWKMIVDTDVYLVDRYSGAKSKHEGVDYRK
jgi:hypothetical protein